jgi:hypothetical protein
MPLVKSKPKRKPGRPPKLKHPPSEKSYAVDAISRLTGADPKTIKKAIARAELKPLATTDRGFHRYSLDEVKAVLEGRGDGSNYAELRAEQIRQQTRESQARADILEMERQEKRGITVTLEEVQAMYAQVLLPVRQAFLSMPSECASKCNPTDPAHAQAALQAWVDGRAFPMIREQLPKIRIEKGK